MAKKIKSELPKGFVSVDKFNGKFTPNGSQFEFSEPVSLNSESKGVVKGLVYRYPLAPDALYFTSVIGERLQDVNGFSFAYQNEQ